MKPRAAGFKFSLSAAGSPDRLRRLQQDEGLDPNLIDLWVTSPEREWYMGRRFRVWLGCLTCIALVILLGMAITSTQPPGSDAVKIVTVGSIVAILILMGWFTVPYWAARRSFVARRRAIATYRVDEALKNLREIMEQGASSKHLQLPRLFELNRRQLDEYQLLTKRQQHVAFVLTWSAAVAAFVVLIAGSVLALRVADADKYITGGLTGLGALLSTFLGKAFFDGHREAMKQLNLYYLEPSLSGRLLAAERMLDHLPPKQREASAMAILTRLLAPETSNADPGQNGAGGSGKTEAAATGQKT